MDTTTLLLSLLLLAVLGLIALLLLRRHGRGQQEGAQHRSKSYPGPHQLLPLRDGSLACPCDACNPGFA